MDNKWFQQGGKVGGQIYLANFPTIWDVGSNPMNVFWLVVYLPLWKIWKSVGMIIPNIWKNKTCSKPPTSNYVYKCLHLEMRINDEILEKSVHESIYEKLVCSGVI